MQSGEGGVVGGGAPEVAVYLYFHVYAYFHSFANLLLLPLQEMKKKKTQKTRGSRLQHQQASRAEQGRLLSI